MLEPHAERSLDEPLVACSRAIPCEPRRDLRVEHVRRAAVLAQGEQQQVCSRRVHHELDRGIGDELGDRGRPHRPPAGRSARCARACTPAGGRARARTCAPTRTRCRARRVPPRAPPPRTRGSRARPAGSRRVSRQGGCSPPGSTRRRDRPRCPHHAGMPLFERSCVVRAPIADVFAFHLDTRNAARISPRTMPVVGVRGSFPLTEGDEVEIVVRLWPTPFTQTWRVQAERIVEPTLVVDRMLQGPFPSWLHQHRFEDMGDGSDAPHGPRRLSPPARGGRRDLPMHSSCGGCFGGCSASATRGRRSCSTKGRKTRIREGALVQASHPILTSCSRIPHRPVEGSDHVAADPLPPLLLEAPAARAPVAPAGRPARRASPVPRVRGRSTT